MVKIKVACPANTVTGGIELLHQVVYECNKHPNVTAELWYIFSPNITEIPSEYWAYNNVVNNKVEDGDVLLFPEIWAHCTTNPQFKNHKKIVYWESVDNYFPHTPQNLWFKFGEGTIHISQGMYSKLFLTDTINVNPKDIIDITDYVNDAYLESDISTARDKVVLYNPVKGMEYTEKLIKLCPDIKFEPIKGMTRAQILSKMLHSMVWIDFGNFPGKDRLPREAGACGMVLITGKRGSSKYQLDMNIPTQYKIGNITYADLGNIANKIREILNNFEDHQKLFCAYRSVLKEEKMSFEHGINELVERLQNEV